MRALVVAVCLVAGCELTGFDEDVQSLEVVMVVPADTDTFELTARDGGACDANGQFAVGGSTVLELDGVRVPVDTGATLPMPPGTFAFEIVALDTLGTSERQLAAGCSVGVIRSRETTVLEITLVPIP